jgi:hypothetical protein
MHTAVQVLEPCFGQLTRLELHLGSSPQAGDINQAPQAAPIPWAQLGKLEALVLQQRKLCPADMHGLAACSSTLASLELGILSEDLGPEVGNASVPLRIGLQEPA